MLRRDRQAQSGQPAVRKRDTGYVSEFAQFMDSFLQEHPEEVQNQETGWNIFWDHRADLEELDQASRDAVPVKGYDYF